MVSRQKALTKVFGDPQVKKLKKLEKRVAVINNLAGKYKDMSDTELKNQTKVLKKRLAGKESVNDILPDAFAVMREAADRHLGMRSFDVQLIGGTGRSQCPGQSSYLIYICFKILHACV
jgi:preprotein translocase subunit SecA